MMRRCTQSYRVVVLVVLTPVLALWLCPATCSAAEQSLVAVPGTFEVPLSPSSLSLTNEVAGFLAKATTAVQSATRAKVRLARYAPPGHNIPELTVGPCLLEGKLGLQVKIAF